jgi:pentatricopeptide repeat protein
VLRVRFGAQNLPDWSSAVIDRRKEERRLREAKQMLDEMKRSDPGGDIKL